MTCEAIIWPSRPSHRPCNHRYESTSSYVSVVRLILVSWIFIPAVTCQTVHTGNADSICGSIDVRNNPNNLSKLSKCSVIEGSLHFVLMEHGTLTPESYEKYTFPNLIEITDSLMIWRVNGLTTLAKMFPNLSVIRGQNLFWNYALVVFENPDLKEIGLSNLTRIERGGVKIEKNANLCFSDTIDWDLISPGTESHQPLHSIKKNMDPSNCPSCPSNCPNSGSGPGYLCWREDRCQRVCNSSCGSLACSASDPNLCCHPSCIGGCTDNSTTGCVACENIAHRGLCYKKCPSEDGVELYDFLDRRCITMRECLNKKVPDRKAAESDSTRYKTVNVTETQNKCLLDCPPNTEVDPNDPTKCKICSQNRCTKVCMTRKISSVADIQKFKGCMKIVGDLVIELHMSADIHALEENLRDVETITGSLMVRHASTLVSLHFFSNLQVIEGNSLDRQKYSLVLLDNINLQKLFPGNRTVKIKRGKAFIHINPKLCPAEIESVRKGAVENTWDETDVSPITNGDRIECTVFDFKVSVRVSLPSIHHEILPKHATGVIVTWQNMANKVFGDYRDLLGYTVYYRRAPRNVTKYEGRDACAKNDWFTYDVPQKENLENIEALIPSLSFYTRYALYIETIAFGVKTKAESELTYFVTAEGVPSEPTNILVNESTSGSLTVIWSPPLVPRGALHTYVVELNAVPAHSDDLHAENGKVRERCQSELPSLPGNKIISPEPKVNVWKNNNDLASGQSDKITPPNNETNEHAQKCYRQCMSPEKTIPSEADASSTKSFEDYIINHMFYKKPISNSSRSKRDASDVSDADTVHANMSSIDATTQSPGEQRSVISQTIYITDSSTKQFSATFTNLTHYTSYDITIRACLTPRNTSYCSDPPTKTRHRTKPIADSDNVLNASLVVESTNSSRPVVIIEWSEPTSPNGLVLAYELEWRLMGKTTAGLGSSRCVPSKLHKRNGNKFILDDQPSGEYEVKVRTRSLAGYSSWSEPLRFEIPDENSSALVMYIVIGFIFFAFLGISVSTSWYLLNKAKENTNNMEYVSMNPEYMPAYEPDEWEIDRKSAKLLQELGQGSFGMVYEGIIYDVIPGRPEQRCAIKTVNDSASASDKMQFLQEASIMKSFNCHHVVKLLGVVSKGTPVLVCMELMEHGDLRDYLRKCRDGPDNKHPKPTKKQVDIMSSQIADGMSYLAAKKFVHRDLAARNCMVHTDLTVKIGDFGMTRDVYETDYYRKGNRGMLPVRWMAPESLKDGIFTTKSDVWAFGVVLWEIVTLGEQPYQGLSNEHVLKYVMRGGLQEAPEGCPQDLFELMSLCWKWNPNDRPSFPEIIERLNVDDPTFRETSFYLNEKASILEATLSSDESAPLNPIGQMSEAGDETRQNFFPSCVVPENVVANQQDGQPPGTAIRVENDDNSNETRNGLNGIPGNKNNSSDESKGSKISNGSVINGYRTSSAC